VLLGQDPEEVARLLEILQCDGIIPHVDDDPLVDPSHEAVPTMDFACTDVKCSEIGVYVGLKRNLEV
jgi:hypothetical protein